jgi:hypothetical protein
MRNSLIYILLLLFLLQVSCKKDEPPPTSGTVTINNTTTLGQTYYVYGFLFSEAKKVSTNDNPPPDITVDSDGTNLVLQANNLKNSFYKAGEYNDATSAKTAYDNLTSATVSESAWEGLASPIKANQIWIYRSGTNPGTNHYAKFRIISTKTQPGQVKPYAECTFEWEYQPDGTLTFPGK